MKNLPVEVVGLNSFNFFSGISFILKVPNKPVGFKLKLLDKCLTNEFLSNCPLFKGIIVAKYLFISIPLNLYIFRTVVHWYKEAVGRADKRVKLVNELITGIRIVKFYAWEKPFKKMIENAAIKSG